MSGKIRAEKLLKFLRKIMTCKQNDKKHFIKPLAISTMKKAKITH
ncbi:hypothetical protein D051_3429 [Vibrio parahaemolyticus VPCR-2010]|nr:hypothetical protein D051_3429 [Vibrio parahaemolyticus VPCR-2010]